jgi:hypothetical protein
MSDDAALFRARAENELAQAKASSLINVRRRSERAAAVWNQMAERADRVDGERRAREAAKADA